MTVVLLIVAAFLLLAGVVEARGGAGPKYKFVWHAAAPRDLDAMIRSSSAVTGVSPERIKAIIYIESRGNPRAINAGDPSYGIMQMQLPIAAYYSGRNVVPANLLDSPAFAIETGARFLADLQRKYAGRFSFGVWAQAYNLGETQFNKGKRNPGYGARVDTLSGESVFLNPGELAEAFAGDF